jgi:uncharacterized membrane protein HdeD (DUF308 family)
MSYDYSSESTKLEMPNPYAVQNRMLFLCAAVLVLAGLWCLWDASKTLAAAPIVVGLALLAAGIVAASVAAKRLRFFFGRGRPRSLAPDLQPTVVGTSPEADYHKELLRHGALIYPEPKGAVDGLLYHLAPRLITAPVAVQEQARVQFFNFAALVVTALSFAFAWLAFGTEATRPWLGVGYFLFGTAFLLRPIVSASSAPLTMASLVALIAAAVLAPAIIGAGGSSLPDLHGWSLAPQTTVMLVAGLVGVLLTMLAVLGQVQPPPATKTSSEQVRLSINVPPSLLLDELERRLQEQWVERIPNRRYARALPVIDPALHAGPFSGELFEETQPMPLPGSTPAGIGQALASTRHKWVLVLDLYALALAVIGTVCALLFVRSIGDPSSTRSGAFALLGAASILFMVSAFCAKGSAKLWGRFDFESTLIWVEMAGTYQTASIGTGNMLNSRMQTSNQIVRTESMTLRVWRARAESVVFGKDGARQVTAMFSTDAETHKLVNHLSEFGRSRASLVAPGSEADAQRLQALGAAERAISAPASPLPFGAAAAQLTAAATARYCHSCGAALPMDARFCPACGTKIENT